MNTKHIGITSELKIAAKFIEYGISIAFPYGDNEPYDLIIRIKDKFYSIQCKTALYENNGNISIELYKRKGYKRIGKELYKDLNVDLCAVYDYKHDDVYLINYKDTNTKGFTIQLYSSKNNQTKNINFKNDYLFENIIQKLIGSKDKYYIHIP